MHQIRNIAIIAHVDHGKTTLVDAMLSQGDTSSKIIDERVMDCNDLEKERGITILAKCTSMYYNDIKYNIIDTPGHADFGGEVERVLSMVDGVILLVDSSEGVMPQTKFVLSKALTIGLKPIVVINKVDRNDSRVDEVLDEIFDLFCVLDATEDQLDFPLLYAVGRDGWASTKNSKGDNLSPLFSIIQEHIPNPSIDNNQSFRMLASILTTDPYVGKILIGRIYSGTARIGDNIKSLDLSGNVIENTKITRLFTFKGTDKIPLEVANAGDIIGLSGVDKTSVSHTICSDSVSDPIKSTPIDPPTMSITINVNTSPLAGLSGSKLTSRMILHRLKQEAETNVAITLKISSNGDSFEVGARGELQLGVLIENMRREGFEISVSRPRILLKNDKHGGILEPIEEVVVDVDEPYSGVVISKLTSRKGVLKEMKSSLNSKARLIFYAPSRGLIGYQTEFRNDTRGTGVLNRTFYEYQSHKGALLSRRNGVLISNSNGDAAAYALVSIENRGQLFISPKTSVYQGMIIGEHSRSNDLEVNPIKGKQLTNMRASGVDEGIKLTPPREFTLEETLSYIKDDEFVEVTPDTVRLRKIMLCGKERKKNSRKDQ